MHGEIPAYDPWAAQSGALQQGGERVGGVDPSRRADCDEPGHSRSVSTALLNACPQPPSAPFSRTVTASRPPGRRSPASLAVSRSMSGKKNTPRAHCTRSQTSSGAAHAVTSCWWNRRLARPPAERAARRARRGHRRGRPRRPARRRRPHGRRAAPTPRPRGRHRPPFRRGPGTTPPPGPACPALQRWRPVVELLGTCAEHGADRGLLSGHGHHGDIEGLMSVELR